jgi:hypothetical protein
MKNKVAEAGTGPAPGTKPNRAGVPGELVSLESLDLVFGRMSKASPYDPLLHQLAVAGTGKALKFGDVRAKASLYARGKKLGLRLSFAIFGTDLYVRFDGRVDDDIRGSRRARIQEALKNGPRSAGELLNAIREKGDVTIDLPTTEAILAQMVRGGELVKREDGKYGKGLRPVAA